MSNPEYPKVIAFTEWSRGNEITKSSRYVVLDWSTLSPHRYSRHMEVRSKSGENSFIFGHYFFDVWDAMKSVEHAVSLNNTGLTTSHSDYIAPGIRIPALEGETEK